MNFSEPSLITPNAPMTSGIISVFICHILVIPFSRSLYLDTFYIIIMTVVKTYVCHKIKHRLGR